MRLFNIYICVLLCALSLSSCDDEIIIIENDTYINFGELFDYEYFWYAASNGDEELFDADSKNVNWYFDNIPECLTIYPMSSEIANNEFYGGIHFQIEPNPTVEERELAFQFHHDASGRMETFDLKCHQSGSIAMLKWVEDENNSTLATVINSEAATFEIPVKTTVPDVTCSSSNPEAFSINYDTRNKKLVITASKNNTGALRETWVTLSSEYSYDLSLCYYIAQYPELKEYNGYECINMGKGYLFAINNVGASSPSEPGEFYNWSEAYTAFYQSSTSTMHLPCFDDLRYLHSFDHTRINDNLIKITATNGNSLFLPCTGYIDDDYNFDKTDPHYWTSEVYKSEDAYAFWIYVMLRCPMSWRMLVRLVRHF